MASAQHRVNDITRKAFPNRRDWVTLLLGLVWSIGAAWWINQAQWVALALWLAVPPLVVVIARAPFAAVPLWILFAPLFARMYGDDTRWLNWLFGRLLFPAALGLSMWSVARQKRHSLRGAGLLEFASVLFVFAATAVILLTGANPSGYLLSFYDLVFVPICAYWLLRLNPPSARDWQGLVVVCAIAFALQLVVSALAWVSPAVLPYAWLGMYGERTVGTLGQPAVYTSALTLFGVIVFFAAHRSSRRKVRALGVVVLVLTMTGMLWSFSRASWLATLVVGSMFVWFYARRVRRALIIGATVTVLVGGIFLVQNAGWVWTRMTDVNRAEERLIDEITSLRMIAARPILGWGFLRHNESRAEFATPLFSGRVVPELVSHNTYLSLIADLGIPLFFLYMTPALWWLWRTWKDQKQFSDARSQLPVLLWLVLAHMVVVSSFTDIISFHPVGTILWWVTLGLVAAGVTDHATI